MKTLHMSCSRVSLSVLLTLAGALFSACTGGASELEGDASVVGDAESVEAVELGTHVQWKQQPDDFITLNEGDALPIVLGHQGAWMVVLALRSEALLVGPVDILVSIEAAGTSLGELSLSEQDLDPELDGRDYIYDIWLIVGDPSLSTYQALVTLEVSDTRGTSVRIERKVVLSGGMD